MLPEDTKKQREALLENLRQANITDHFAEAKPEERVPLYTDEIFKEAAIQWLVETDQVSCCIVLLSLVFLNFLYDNLARIGLRTSSIPEHDVGCCQRHTRHQASQSKANAKGDHPNL